jgi:type VI secretion system protein ImpJ
VSRTHRVLWGEGVFLRPQHFQQQERFFEALHARGLAFTHAHPWGVDAVALDREALAAGLLSLTNLEVTFQDGTALDAPARDPLPTARRLEDRPDLGLETLVHVALPLLNAFGGNCEGAGETSGRLTRFRQEHAQVADLFTEALEAELAVLRPQPRLLLEGENRDGHLALPIARLVKDPAGAWSQDEAYVPPLAALRGAPPVLALLRRLVDILRLRSRALAAAHRERTWSVLEYGTSDIATFWLLHTVNRAYPHLNHLLAFPQAHPEEAYKALAQLAGELLTFSSTRTLADLPPYHHEGLTTTFQDLDSLLRELLETVISSRYAVIPLLETRPSFHVGRLDSDRLTQACDFYLSVSGAGPVADWLEAVPLKLKVGSPDDVEKTLNSALPGVALRHVSQTPAAVPVRLGNQYYALEAGGALFDRMLTARAVCIYVPQALPPVQLELIAVFP